MILVPVAAASVLLLSLGVNGGEILWKPDAGSLMGQFPASEKGLAGQEAIQKLSFSCPLHLLRRNAWSPSVLSTGRHSPDSSI